MLRFSYSRYRFFSRRSTKNANKTRHSGKSQVISYINSPKIYVILKSQNELNMDMIEQKLELIKWIGDIEDETLIHHLNSIKNNELQEVGAISPKDIQSIQKGIKQVELGQTTSYEEVIKPYEKYIQG